MQEVIYEKLKEVARAKKLITYTEIGDNVGLRANDPQLWQLLDKVNRQEHGQGRPMLSAVVVQKEGENYGAPGDGFFKLAKDLGVFKGDHKYIFWVSELNVVHNYWSSH
jgi:hypothetical protein